MPDRFTLPPEPRPGDFAVRFARRRVQAIGPARGRRHRGRRGTLLAAALAMPAFAAPGGWNHAFAAFEIGDAGRAEATIAPMPFEQPGQSFPGSAFYYLAPQDEARYWTDRPASRQGRADFLPAARSLHIGSAGLDRTRALQCLTAAIYYEARSEPDAGQRAVAQVVLNRVAHPAYPDTVCGVVYQGSERTTGCQFTFTCDGSLARAPQPLFWRRAESVARAALSGFVYTPVGLATHYHTIAVNPNWAPNLAYLGTIGAHRFYSFHGRAGQPATFRFAYAGGEPLAAPHPRRSDVPTSDAASTALDPLQLQRAYSQGGPLAGTAAVTTQIDGVPATLHQDQALPAGGGVRPEYARSGSWIGTPPT